jgi:2-keto-4-pentenoate hydratase/2-oxohepta-3-ene-1,7-dioic acid hydratase in catechol pathway
MKLGRIAIATPDGEQIRLVAARPEEGRVVDLARAYALTLQRKAADPDRARAIALTMLPGSLSAGIGGGDAFLDAAHAALAAADDASFAIDEVSWRAAVDSPVIRDGLTFEQHIQNFSRTVAKAAPARSIYNRPGYFKGTTATSLGHDEVLAYPDFTEALDWELEVGYVVGKSGTDLTPDEALDHLFGITIFNDFSARDVQGIEMPIGMGPQKSKDFAYGIGPWVVTMDEIESIEGLKGQVRVNGEVLSDTKVEDFVYTPAELLAYVSISDRLQPGDIIGSGTMGFGAGVEIGRFLQPGDVIELELEGVGTLRTPVSTERQKAPWWPEPRPYPHEGWQA